MHKTSHALLDADLTTLEGQAGAIKWMLSGVRHKMFLSKKSPGEPFINSYLIIDALLQAQNGLRKYRDPDAFKTGGHVCFWVSRLKPFRAFLTENPSFTNEVMALQIGLCIVAEDHGVQPIPDFVYSNLLHDLRYGHTAPMTVANQFQLLYLEKCKGH